MRDGRWKFLLLLLQQVNSQAGCTLFNHDCDDWKFIIKINEACMNYHGVNDITKWRVNSVDAASVTDNSCKFDPTPVGGEYTLEFGVDDCGNAESMSNEHKIWTAVIDNKDTNAGIYTSQKISEPFSCKYNKGHVVVSNEMAVSASQLNVNFDTETGVQNDTLDAPLILYDRKWTCTGVEGINRTCFDGVEEPGVEITENYPVPIGLEVRLQFKLDLEHKLDYCKVFDKDPSDLSVTPSVDDYLLRDGCLNGLGGPQWINKNQKNLEFKAFAFNEGGQVFFKCQLHLCTGSYCDMPTLEQCSNGVNNTALFAEYLDENGGGSYAQQRISNEMLDRKRRTIEISGRIPRFERQAEENSVAFTQDPTGSPITGSASMTPITAGGKKVSNKGVTMIVAGEMADRFDSYEPINRPLHIYYGHETSDTFRIVSSIFCTLAVAIIQFL